MQREDLPHLLETELSKFRMISLHIDKTSQSMVNMGGTNSLARVPYFEYMFMFYYHLAHSVANLFIGT